MALHTFFDNLFSYLFTPDPLFGFCSIRFWILFVVFFALFLLIRKDRRHMMQVYVVLFSLLIAYCVNCWLMLLLPLTAFLSWYMTEMMKTSGGGKYARRWLTATIIIALVPLVFFKYCDFLTGTVNSIFGSGINPLQLTAVVGLSYYTFQAISYSVDVYKGKVDYDVDLLEYIFYITFFPLLFCGPITRTNTLIPQLRADHQPNPKLPGIGFWLIILGLLKKGLIADYIGQYVNWIFEDPNGFSGFEVAFGAVGFTAQLYCDFSGYCDIAIGIASLMGFELLANFDFPFKSQNITEFWHRWHIALSTWFRDYVYIPMGGNRCGSFRTYLNNFITMLVAGLWHGASWMFVIWGALHGLGLVVHKTLRKRFLDKIPDSWPVRAFCIFLTVVFFIFTLVFFRSPDLATAMDIFSKSLTDFDWAYFPPFWERRTLLVIFLFLAYFLHYTPKRWHDRLKSFVVDSHWIVKLIIFAVTVQLVINFSQANVQPLLYAQF